MEICSIYKSINRSVINVAKSINKLEVPEEPVVEKYVRLEESPFKISEETKRTCQVVTAHNLFEYKNSFHSIKLKESSDSWLEVLLKIDEREEE